MNVCFYPLKLKYSVFLNNYLEKITSVVVSIFTLSQKNYFFINSEQNEHFI